LKSILTDPKEAEFIADGNISLTIESYEVMEPTTDGVNVKFSRHCYPDIIVPTVISNKGDQSKVDLMATLQAQMKKMVGATTTERYCYGFTDQKMQGLLDGKPWQADNIQDAAKAYGIVGMESITLYSEPCPEEGGCFAVKSPRIILNFDLKSDGGNFSNKSNITLHFPPNKNQMVSTGSYRISSDGNGKTKLEISFFEDENNHIDGYLVFENDI
jgi:hypothetical protein